MLRVLTASVIGNLLMRKLSHHVVNITDTYLPCSMCTSSLLTAELLTPYLFHDLL